MQDFSNNASGIITVGITNSASTITLGDASRFPSPAGGSYFLATLVGLNTNGQESTWEIVKCTARVGNVLTVARGQEGTTALAWGVGTLVELRLTAGFANAIDDHIDSTSNPHAVTKAQVGLGNVPNLAFSGSNTGDETTATIKTKLGITTLSGSNTGDQVIPTTLPASDVSAWAKAATKPTYTAAEIGLGNVPNLSFSGSNTGDETESTIKTKLGITTLSGSNTGDQTDITGNAATATALSLGADRTKLDGIEAGANNYAHPASHAPSIITQDASNRFVTDAEKSTWNAKQPAGTYATGTGTATGTNTGDQDLSGKQDVLVSGTSIKTVNSTSLLGAGNIITGDVTLTGTQTLTNKTLTGYTETTYNLTGTDIAVSNGTIQTKTLSANTTFTESLADGQSVILGITAGAYSVTWPSITWSKVGGSGTAPTLTSTGVNWIILWQVGGVLRGSFLGTA